MERREDHSLYFSYVNYIIMGVYGHWPKSKLIKSKSNSNNLNICKFSFNFNIKHSVQN